MKLCILSFIFIIYSFHLNAQISCGTDAPEIYQKFSSSSSKQQLNQSFCINISTHIVQTTNASGGFSSNNIPLIIENLNNSYNRYNIFFENVSMDTINDDDYYNLIYDVDDKSNLYALFDRKENSNAIDLYLVNTLKKINSDDVIENLAGVAYDVLSKQVVVKNARALQSTTIHEIGHALNLLHTHAKLNGIENIERSGNNKNCDSVGDKLCDTPADPNLDDKVDVSCNYNGNEYRNGLPYEPNTHNYMSYSRKSCRDEFTQGQVDVMKDALANASILQPVISSSCAIPAVTGPFSICENSDTVFTIQNPPNSFTWSVTGDLQIVSSTSTTVTVHTGSSPGSGTIYANYNNGAQATKYVSIIDEPRAYSYDSNGNKNYSGGGFYFEQSYFAKGSFSVFADSRDTNLNWSGPSDLNWYNLNNNTVEFDLNIEGNYLFTVTAENDCGSFPYFVSLKIGGIGPDPMFTVAPNPVESNTLVVQDVSSNSKDLNNISSNNKTLSNNVTFTLYDFNGQIVQTETMKRGAFGKEYRLDVSGLKNQNYFIKITCGAVEETYQIILNK